MAEVSIWAQDDANSQGIRLRMASVCEVLRKDCRAGRKAPGFIPEIETSRQEESWGGETVQDALQVLLSAFEGGSADADKAATEFGRNGGHIFLLQLLETEGVDDESDRTRELAATAVEHCMSLCARFPMKAATVDAKNVCDTMRCEIEIDSALNRCGGVVKVYLRRRSNPNDTESSAAINISNMLWAGSLVLGRYLQANPHLIPSGSPISSLSSDEATCRVWSDEHSLSPLPSASTKHACSNPARILEIGAGLGAGGLCAAALARHLNKHVHVLITDCEPGAVDMICSSIRSNDLAPPHSATPSDATAAAADTRPIRDCRSRGALHATDAEAGSAHTSLVYAEGDVLDWDRIEDFSGRWGDGKFELILAAEVVHELSHAPGVIRAIRHFLAPGGTAILVNGAKKHRFGVQEFSEMLQSQTELEFRIEDVGAELTQGIESLQDGSLNLQIYTITWRP